MDRNQQAEDLRRCCAALALERDTLRSALQQMVADFDGCYAENEPAMIKARAALSGESND